MRNSFSRLLSCYLDRIVGRYNTRPRRQLNRLLGTTLTDEVTFDQFIKAICEQESVKMNDHWRDQYSSLLRGRVKFDFIGRFENIADDLRTVFQATIPHSDLYRRVEKQNKSPQTTSASNLLSQFYSDELTSFVAERYAKDFEVYGYDKPLPK